MKRLIIFDFDGVIADSEVLSNTVLAECLSEAGVPTTRDDSYRLYMGRRMPEIIAAAEAARGERLPPQFAGDFEARTLARFRSELRVVAGASDYIAEFPQLARCIASSSTPARLALSLDVLGLREVFGSNVFSALEVPRGKPHPDIFLHAAQMMGCDPEACLVIEDSAGGVQAALAARMTVIGLLAASHIRDGHGDTLKQAGAHVIAKDFAEVGAITRRVFGL